MDLELILGLIVYDARKYIEKLKKENPNVEAEIITCKFGKPILQYYG